VALVEIDGAMIDARAPSGEVYLVELICSGAGEMPERSASGPEFSTALIPCSRLFEGITDFGQHLTA
jgi:hypothetical protein